MNVELILNLKKMKQENDEDGWIAEYVQCDLCSHKWTAVYLAKLIRLECPNCTNMVIFDNL
jgi:formate dehydrogenase maturation protein FdhE